MSGCRNEFEEHDITDHRGSSTISSFFHFFFFLVLGIQLREERKRREEQEVATALRTARNIPKWRPREFTGCTERRAETMPAGQKRQKTRTQYRSEAMCAAAQRKRVHVLSPCFFSNDRVPRNTPARRCCSPSFLTSSAHISDLIVRCIEPTSSNK